MMLTVAWECPLDTSKKQKMVSAKFFTG
jgi:hypothetical protein